MSGESEQWDRETIHRLARGISIEQELDQLRADNARLKSRVEGYEKQWTDMDYTIGQSLKQQLATYKAAVAEAREALLDAVRRHRMRFSNNVDQLYSLSTPYDKALHTLSALTGDATKPT